MKILVVLGHPDPGSLNHALAATAVSALEQLGHKVLFHDLYAEGFEALLPAEEIPEDGPVDPKVLAHCEELAAADGIVIVHPNWWGMPPAILKGWIDRVVRPGVAYRFLEDDCGEGVPEGLLKAKTAVVLNTSNTQRERELAAFGDPLDALWTRCVFGLCGVEDVRRRNFGVVCVSSAEERQRWLEEAGELVREAFGPSARV